FARAASQASTAAASVRSMSFESHVNPSPSAHQSIPRSLPAFASPTFHDGDFRNWTTHTRKPRPAARNAVPSAAVVFPLPSPVLTKTNDVARLRAGRGPVLGGAMRFGVLTAAAPAGGARRLLERVQRRCRRHHW